MAQATTATNPRAVLKPKRPARQYTLEEYLRREEKSVDKHEYYDGKIIKMPYAKGPHNIIAANVTGALKAAIRAAKKPLIVFGSDQKIYFPDLNYGVYADTLVVCEKPIYWDDNSLLLTNPLLVVEVLSKSTESYDRSGKFDEYKTLNALREYVLIRQDRIHAESWFRESPGRWQETIVTDRQESLLLPSIGCSIALEDIYEFVHIE